MKVSKLAHSRNNWKGKAKRRGSTIRDLRKASTAHKKRHARDEQKIRSLEDEVAALRQALSARGCPTESPDPIPYRTLCVLIVVCAIVSFRSVPRILQVFQPLLRAAVRIPHFTSVIHWTLRVGIAIFNQVSTIADQWVAIIDCSIDIGTRKALVVLRVRLSALHHKQEAIGPRDCECIGLEISPTWNGPLVSAALGRIFERSGIPCAIVKDGGSDLNKGVKLFCADKPERNICTIDDAGHFAANALKAQFAKSRPFTAFLKIASQAAAKIRQTDLAWLLPPKLRTKGRFQGITELAKWARKILDLIGSKGNAEDKFDLGKVRKTFAGLAKLRSFLDRFCLTCSITEAFLALMKTRGLNDATYIEASAVLAKLPARSLVRIRLSTWLEKHIKIHRQLAMGQLPLVVSTDAIESLFGLFKTVVQRNPQAEINRLIYVLPLLCGNYSYSEIDRALNRCSHAEMLHQIEQTVPPTLRQQRTQQFKKPALPVPKSGGVPSLQVA
jgi:hypothetical protein